MERFVVESRDVVWVAVGSLLSALLALVAHGQLVALHFAAWELYPSRAASTGAVEMLRRVVLGWMGPILLVVFLAAGFAAVRRLMQSGRWGPAAVLVGGALTVLVAIEVTQAVGQETTPTSQVDHVSPVSLVVAAALVVVPLSAAVWTLRGRG